MSLDLNELLEYKHGPWTVFLKEDTRDLREQLSVRAGRIWAEQSRAVAVGFAPPPRQALWHVSVAEQLYPRMEEEERRLWSSQSSFDSLDESAWGHLSPPPPAVVATLEEAWGLGVFDLLRILRVCPPNDRTLQRFTYCLVGLRGIAKSHSPEHSFRLAQWSRYEEELPTLEVLKRWREERSNR